MTDIAAFKDAFTRIASEAYPRLISDDPSLYQQGRTVSSAQDDYRTELSQAIEEAMAEVGEDADDAEDLAPYYEATDELLPRLADWITES